MRKVKYRRTSSYMPIQPKYFKSTTITTNAVAVSKVSTTEYKSLLKEAIENLSSQDLSEVFREKKDYLFVGKYRTKGILTKLYEQFLKSKGFSEYSGLIEVYSLVCQKQAMDFMSQQGA